MDVSDSLFFSINLKVKTQIMPKNIIVSNRLPVQAQKGNDSWSFTPTSGGLATGMKSVHQEGDSLWVGWPGISSDILDKKVKIK